tara:strand:- start:468 stop:674 length:207 start_codon:yes stop_codon:yes gene_type:complete
MLNKKGVINMKQSSKDYLDELWVRTEFKNIVKTSTQKSLIQMCLLVVTKMTTNSFKKFIKLYKEQESA